MIQLSEEASRWIQRRLQKRGGGLGVRLGVKRAGCSGYSYFVDFVDEAAPDEQRFLCGGVAVFVREEDLALLEGVTLQLKRQGLNERLSFEHPRAVGTCGCGASFSHLDSGEL